MQKIVIDRKEYFDNSCKGEDMWGQYRTANGDLYIVADGASNHDGSKTGLDVIRLIHARLKQASAGLKRSSELRELIHAINSESSDVNAGAYAAIAGLLHRGSNLYAFGAGDVSIIAKKVNEKLIQVLPLDLNMQREAAEKLVTAEIGKVVNNINITEENYEQRVRQYMNHGLSNAIGVGGEFVLHEKYFDAKPDTALLMATDGVTDSFMNVQSKDGSIQKSDAEKFYEVFSSGKSAKQTAAALEATIWNTRVIEKKKIKPDDRTALFLHINAVEEADAAEKNFNAMPKQELAMALLRKIEEQNMTSMDSDLTVSRADLGRMADMANELLRKLERE